MIGGDYWQWYEQRIAELFQKLPNALVEENVRMAGKKSGKKRQLDLRITVPVRVDLQLGFEIEIPFTIIVDAKARKRPVDVKTVESIGGLRDDVEAHLAVIVSPVGFSEAARKRASSLGVYPLVASGDLLSLIRGFALPKYQQCLMDCLGEDGERPPSVAQVSWHPNVLLGGVVKGYCTWCNTLHLMCPDCSEVTGIAEAQFDMGVLCQGECGRVYYVSCTPEYEVVLRSWDGLEVSLLTAAYDKSTKRLTHREVDRQIKKTKWQHWTVAHPAIGLTEEGLMCWDNNFLYLTEEGEQVVREVVGNAEYSIL